MFGWLKKLFAAALTRKKKDEEWAKRFNQPPADPNKGKLPLDPSKDPWTT